jgi:hypothetical protein
MGIESGAESGTLFNNLIWKKILNYKRASHLIIFGGSHLHDKISSKVTNAKIVLGFNQI